MRFLLALSIILLFSFPANGVPVNPASPDGVAAIVTDGGTWNMDVPIMVLTTEGQVRQLHSGNYWVEGYGYPSSLPVELSEVSDWGPRHIRLHSGEHWVFNYSLEWHKVGAGVVPLPCDPPVGVVKEPLGNVKSLYR